jgi:nucleolin
MQKPSLKETEVENSEGASSDESSDDSSDNSSDISDEEEIEEKEVVPKPQKRKAEGEDASVAKKGKTEAAEGNSTTTGNLFVGNLSWNVDEEWLRSEFEEFGELSGVRIVTDRDSGRSRGYGSSLTN